MKIAYVLPLVLLSGCASVSGMFDKTPDAAPASVTAPPAGEAPTSPAAEAIRPPAGARTADQFDTTSAEERSAASAPPEPAGERSLGTTVASLGDPSRSGFWLETPLVTDESKGRVVYNGKSAQVDLIPIGGPATGGSRLSLAAMRLIEAPLTDLPTIEVYAGG